MSEYRYFKVTGGKIKAAVDDFCKTRREQTRNRIEFAKEVGAVATYANESEVIGFVFADGQTTPKGWVCVSAENKAWRPFGNAKGNRKLFRRMREDYKLWGCYQLQELVQEQCGGNLNVFRFMIGNRFKLMSLEFQETGLALLCVPAGEWDSAKQKWTPPDDGCVELKMSEYWKMKEDAK